METHNWASIINVKDFCSKYIFKSYTHYIYRVIHFSGERGGVAWIAVIYHIGVIFNYCGPNPKENKSYLSQILSQFFFSKSNQFTNFTIFKKKILILTISNLEPISDIIDLLTISKKKTNCIKKMLLQKYFSM